MTALQLVIARHDALSLRVDSQRGRATLRLSDAPMPWAEDLSHHDPSNAWREALLLAQKSASLPLDPSQCMTRAGVVHVCHDEHLVILVMHMMVSDGSSLDVIFSELLHIVSALRTGREPALPPAPSYIAYARQQTIDASARDAAVTYWVKHLGKGALTVNIPQDHEARSQEDIAGIIHDVRLNEHAVSNVAKFCGSRGITRFSLALASVAVLLRGLSGNDRVIIPVPVSTRDDDTQNAVGHFLNTVAYRLDLSGSTTFLEAVRRASHALWTGFDYHHGPFQHVMAALRETGGGAPNIMVAQNTAPRQPWFEGGLQFFPLHLANNTSKFELAFIVSDEQDLQTRITARRSLFDPPTIIRWGDLLMRIIAIGMEFPDRPIERLWSESAQVSTVRDLSVNVHVESFCAAFERVADLNPDIVAIECGEQALTYAELKQRVGAVHQCLLDRGIRRGDFVILQAARSTDTYLCYLALLRAGAVVVPIDSNWPRHRTDSILNECMPKAVLTVSEHCSIGNVAHWVMHDLVDFAANEAPPVDLKMDDPAYVIYTSGTTGAPKGALLPHRALANLLEADCGALGLGVGCRVAQFASLTVDASVWDIVATLSSGATLVIAPDSIRTGSTVLSKFLKDNSITVIKCPPSILSTLPDQLSKTLKVIISAGEPCRKALLLKWRGVRTFNAYGPTEAGVWATFQEVGPECKERVEAGKAIPGVAVSVRNSYGESVERGCLGEIWIGGAGVALGYVGRQDLTGGRFVDLQGERWYRTGDVGRLLSDGRITINGRIDRQIKLRGVRIQPEEVEDALRKHPEILRAAVFALPTDDPRELVACFQSSNIVGNDTLMDHLRGILPEAFFPSKFERIEEWPTTPGGKNELQSLQLIVEKKESVPSNGSDGTSFYEAQWEPFMRVGVRRGVHANSAVVSDDCAKSVRMSGDDGAPVDCDTVVRALAQDASEGKPFYLVLMPQPGQGLEYLLPFAHVADKLSATVSGLTVFAITRGAFHLPSDKRSHPNLRAAAAFAKVLSLEIPHAKFLHVDRHIDTVAKDLPTEDLLHITSELASGSIVAERDGLLFRRKLVDLDVGSVGEETCFRSDGVYIFFGGFGGVARAIALRAARDVKCTIVLASRRAPAYSGNRADLTANADEKYQFIRRLEGLGSHVISVPVDVADSAAVQSVLGSIYERCGRITGVLQCAGVPNPAVFASLDSAKMRRSFEGKVVGTQVLLRLLANYDLEFFAISSSTASFLGGFGSLAYTAANLIQEGHGEESPLQSIVTIAWGPWRESGMAARAIYPEDVRGAINKRIQAGLSDDHGYRAFVKAVSLRKTVYVVNGGLPTYEGLGPSALSEVVARGAPSRRRRSHMDIPFRMPTTPLETWLVTRYEQVLCMVGVGADDDLFALGGHSLNAAHLATLISDDLGVNLSLAEVFRSPTAAKLAETLARVRDAATLDAIAGTLLYVAALPAASIRELQTT